jgi:hypothetical protein
MSAILAGARRKDGYYDPRQDAATTAQGMTLFGQITVLTTNTVIELVKRVSAYDGYTGAKKENLEKVDSCLTTGKFAA